MPLTCPNGTRKVAIASTMGGPQRGHHEVELRMWVQHPWRNRRIKANESVECHGMSLNPCVRSDLVLD